MEVIEKRSSEGAKVDPEPVEVFGSVAGFIPARNRLLVRRQVTVEQIGGIIKPAAAMELSDRGQVIAVGSCAPEQEMPPIGSIVTISQFCEAKEFDDQGDDKYALPWVQDVRGWHLA